MSIKDLKSSSAKRCNFSRDFRIRSCIYIDDVIDALRLAVKAGPGHTGHQTRTSTIWKDHEILVKFVKEVTRAAASAVDTNALRGLGVLV